MLLVEWMDHPVVQLGFDCDGCLGKRTVLCRKACWLLDYTLRNVSCDHDPEVAWAHRSLVL